MTEERLTAMKERFRANAVRRLRTLEEWYIGDLDHGAALDEAHKLAGSLGTFGHPDGSLAAARLEHLLTGHLEDGGSDPRSDPEVPRLLNRIRDSLA